LGLDMGRKKLAQRNKRELGDKKTELPLGRGTRGPGIFTASFLENLNIRESVRKDETTRGTRNEVYPVASRRHIGTVKHPTGEFSVGQVHRIERYKQTPVNLMAGEELKGKQGEGLQSNMLTSHGRWS